MRFIAALIPSGINETDLGRDAVRELMTNAVSAVTSAIAPRDCLVVTDSPHIASLCEPLGISSVPLQEVQDGSPMLGLSPGVRAVIRQLARTREPDGAAVLLVNPFNPMLSATMVRRAMEEFGKDPARPLVSMSKCRDHPCQFQRFFRMADIDVLYLLDMDFPADRLPPGVSGQCAVSLPFRLHRVEKHLMQAKPGELTSCLDSRMINTLENGRACLVDSASEGRMVFEVTQDCLELPSLNGEDPSEYELRGLFGSLSSEAALFMRIADGEHCVFFRPYASRPKPPLLRLIPISPTRTYWERVIEPQTGSNLNPMLLFSDAPSGATGFIACFLESPTQGEYDFQEPYLPPNATWGMKGDKLVNLETGRRIHGRQVFPDVLHPDGTLTVVPLDAAPEGGNARPSPRPLVLEDAQSGVVRDRIDYLRYLSRKMALES